MYDVSGNSDINLIKLYESNGLFAKIIDAPAEEAIKHGFALDDVKDQELIDFYEEALEELDWEETAINAIRWARLFGGSIAVMLINDGRGIDEPLDWKNIQSIDDIRVYDRSIIRPDYNTIFRYSPEAPFRSDAPEYYYIYSKYGNFKAHGSRCLIFKNNPLPENTPDVNFEFWGIPEYYKLQKALSETELCHGYAIRLLERAHQSVHKINNLSDIIATDKGADKIKQRLELIALTRSMLNTVVIDKTDDYKFLNADFSGVDEIVKSAYYHLSAVSSIPQKILFGTVQEEKRWWRGYESVQRMWQNNIEDMQVRMLRNNLHYLLTVIFQAGVNTKVLKGVPKIKIFFNSMRNLSSLERAQAESNRAAAQLQQVQAAQAYVNIGSLSPGEVRKGLSSIDKFDIATLIDKK